MLDIKVLGGVNLLPPPPPPPPPPPSLPLFGGLPAKGPNGCAGDYGAFSLKLDKHINMHNRVLAKEK